jgi:hypothetical protein
MTTAAPTRTHTALALLFGPEEDTPEALAHRILSAQAGRNLGSALAALPEAIRAAAVSQVTTAAAGLLDINLADVLVAGWREHKNLTAAARHTLAVPGSTELVDLASHRVAATQAPYVSVLVDGRSVATIRFELTLVFDVSALLAEIHAGRLAALRTGRCDITGTLAIQGIDAVTRQARLDLPGAIPLGQGIRLLPAHDYPANEGAQGSGAGSASAA